jgi:hypothetical protein
MKYQILFKNRKAYAIYPITGGERIGITLPSAIPHIKSFFLSSTKAKPVKFPKLGNTRISSEK